MHCHMEAFKKVDVIATPTYNWVINAEVFLSHEKIYILKVSRSTLKKSNAIFHMTNLYNVFLIYISSQTWPTLSRCNWSAQHAKEAVG